MLDRTVEAGLLDVLGDEGIGCATFSSLAQGLLTDKYLAAVPDDSRMARGGSLPASRLDDAVRAKLQALNALAEGSGRSLAQMALLWVLRDARVTTAILGARTVAQLDATLDALHNPELNPELLDAIAAVLSPSESPDKP
jgi:L-glyceraldehyde 3-phosphate reductase